MYQIDFTAPSHVHFIGIGGISMSALAELLFRRGFTVSGSDLKPSPLTERLAGMGVSVSYGQRFENISPDTSFAVYTAAVHPDNEEFLAAEAAGIPLVSRAELVGAVMEHYPHAAGVSGTHGKTTTTSMLSLMLLEAGLEPTILGGGVLDSIGGNLHMGRSNYFITEACEYTNSFLKFHPTDIIITNIEAEHLDFFKDLADIRRSFAAFAALLPENGTLIMQGDIDAPEEIRNAAPASCRFLTYGIAAGAEEAYPYDLTAKNISYDGQGFPSYDLFLHGTYTARLSLRVIGEHNVLNSLAAAALALRYGATPAQIAAALLRYTGTRRRFEYRGSVNGVRLYDDYAHHPTEIAATLRAAQNCSHRELWCVFQPHTYSRTRAFLKEFAEVLSFADHIVLADIYSAARETDSGDISSRNLLALLAEKGKDVYYFPSFSEIETFLLKNCRPDDLLIIMGAGDIVSVSDSLLKK